MKKSIAIVLGIILAMGLFGGCMGMGNDQAPMESNTPQTDTQNPMDEMQQATQSTVDTSKFIGEEKAKEMALSKAGISAEGVTFDRVELDNGDGVWKYEVEFRQGTTEYDVDVKADDGAILKYEKDEDNN